MDVGRFKFKSTSLLELKNMFPIVVKLSNKQPIELWFNGRNIALTMLSAMVRTSIRTLWMLVLVLIQLSTN